ncbi:TetR/AcrR family transcriptional regulator [Streptomyces sp. LHD-70]|uniref:TetR/AcrR family transcriptional regulator n=1 Tax=Streptomyces sp. LHD-70 TaxID=3072140 RepID=UPI0028105351|nr:TetR/AcrR family transcriptional regulator [Streptomyces sp. LHD-70]MDQ8707965.1 TetR/AcrR family transcriptional regulator [Streptomyces sp. LHD-70]
MSPKQVDRAARRQKVLDAAVRVFARKGFAAARIEDVATEAGIGKGSVYLEFGSREELLGAAFEAYADRSAAVLRQAAEGSGPALDRLAALVDAVVELLAGEPDRARIVLDVWAVSRDGTTCPIDMAGVYRAHRAAITALLREAAAEGTVRAGVGERHAAVIVGAIEGCLLQWLLDPRVPLAELAAPLTEMCLEGLRPKEAA